MTREEAISLLTQVKKIILGSKSWLDSTHQPIEEAFGMAIEALANAPNVLNALDTISRQAAIDAMSEALKRVFPEHRQIAEKCLNALPSAQPEQLTDKEQRIFLAAMGREEKVCKQVDHECRKCREPYEDSLMWVCHEITRKVKAALWET